MPDQPRLQLSKSPFMRYGHLWIVAFFAAVVFVLIDARPAFTAFTNVTGAAGIDYFFDPKPNGYAIPIMELLSGAAAASDYDNDGWVDLYVTRYYAPDVLYRNNGNGTFSDVTAAAFGGLPTRNTNGVAWGDLDNDGDADLYVSSIGQRQHFLYINDGAGHFTEQAVSRGAAVGSIAHTTAGTSVSFGDYDNDGWLDIYVGEWRGPTASVSTQARLLRNLGSASPGHFVDATDIAGVSMELTTGPKAGRSYSFTPRFVDFDRDGHQDIVVGSELDTTRLFWNNGNGTFTDGTVALGLDFGNNDMGLAVGDVNGDGWLDWYTTDIYDLHVPRDSRFDGNRLYLNNGDRTFIDSSPPVSPPGQQNNTVRNTAWGWGTQLFDHDNDGDLDLIATNGYYYAFDQFTNDRTRFFVNDGTGAFIETAILQGIVDTGQGRGLLTFDYDKDGDIDVFIVNNHQAPVLYRNNNANTNDWLDIKVVGTISNRDGVGAFITVTPNLDNPAESLVWEVTGSSTYLSQSEKLAHFGLGDLAGTIDLIQIKWSASGILQQFTDVASNQVLTVIESNGDYNDDGVVDAADYTVWRDRLNDEVAPGTRADGNADGVINEGDYLVWRQTYGRAVHQVDGDALGSGLGRFSIPEPTAGVLWGAAVLILGCGRAESMGSRPTRCRSHFSRF